MVFATAADVTRREAGKSDETVVRSPAMTPPIDMTKRYTIAEYHEFAAAGHRLEYREGKVAAVPVGTECHDRIVKNGRRALAVRLAGAAPDVFARGTRVRVTDKRYCYPDLGVARSAGDGTADLADPLLLAEVYSPETDLDDRADRFAGYREIGGLEAYLLIARDRPRVEQYHADADGTWLIHEPVEGLDAVAHLRALDVDLPLAELYAGVTFPPRVEPRWLHGDEGAESNR